MKWYWIVAIVAGILGIVISRRGEGTGNLFQQPFVPTGAGTDADIDTLIQRGQMIQAIKIYRTLHNVGLKEAKDAVDARAKELVNPT